MAEINLKATNCNRPLILNPFLRSPPPPPTQDPALHSVLFQRFSPLYAKKQVTRDARTR